VRRLTLVLPAILIASPAAAHVGVGPTGSFLAGVQHPLLGADHLVVMVAVGVWAALRGGRAVWVWPAAFVTVMLAGFALAMAGIRLPAAEPAVLASVAVLGIAAALALDVPTIAGAAIIFPFALAHGHVHGTEIAGATPLNYVAGFVVATASLHLVGIGLARVAQRPVLARALRVATAVGAGLTVAAGAGL
jgi:urease accessory protein